MAFPSGYTKYQEVVIDNTKVAADLTDYIVYVDLADLVKAGADIFDTCRTDGGDIRVTKSDGTTELAREVVVIDTTAKTGELHVKFTGTLASASDTTIRIWYNGTDTEPAADSTYGSEAVWSDYEAVLHLEETTGTRKDSTGNGDWTDATTPAAASVIGKGADFDGSTDYITATRTSFDDLDGNDFNVQLWAQPDVDITGYLFLKGNQSGDWRGVAAGGSNRVFANVDNGSSNTLIYSAVDTFEAGDTTFLRWTRSGTTGTLYINSLTPVTTTHHIDEDTGTDAFYVGARFNGSVSSYFDGSIDEFRIRASALSGDWHTTEFNNQNSPSTFYSVGDEEGASSDVTETPSTLSATFSVPTYTLNTDFGATITASTQVITSSIPTYAVTVDSTALVIPNTQVATFDVPTYASGTVTSVVLNTLEANLSLPAFIVEVNSEVAISEAVLTFTIPSYSVLVPGPTVVTPETQLVTCTTITPAVSLERSIIVSVVSEVLTFTVPSLLKSGGVWTKRGRATDAVWIRRSHNDD